MLPLVGPVRANEPPRLGQVVKAGQRRLALSEPWKGSCGAIQGAKMAARTITSRMAAPTSPSRPRRRVRQARCRGLRCSLLMVRNHLSYIIKNVDFFLIFVCALTAWAVIAVTDGAFSWTAFARARASLGGRFPARVAAVCIGLMAVDLGPTTFQSVFREHYGFKQPMYQRVLALDGPYKMIERQVLEDDVLRHRLASGCCRIVNRVWSCGRVIGSSTICSLK